MIEVPIYFIVIMAVLVAAGFSTAYAVHATMKSKVQVAERALANGPFIKSVQTQRLQLVSDKKHGLQRCWKSGSYYWNWLCECGVGEQISSDSTEEKAITKWRSHVETHERLVLPTNELSHAECDKRFVGLWALFEKWRTACYCQTTSNDLILLNQEAKKFEKKEVEKDVQAGSEVP